MSVDEEAGEDAYAEVIDIGLAWDWGAPSPVLLDGRRTIVVFYLAQSDDAFDGTNPRQRDPVSDPGVGVVNFVRPRAVRMGAPNDEVLAGHPLRGHGLEFSSAHIVHNSPWIRELIDINRVHPRFRAERWQSCKHYLFTFKDETLECVADGLEVAVEEAPMAEVVLRLAIGVVG